MISSDPPPPLVELLAVSKVYREGDRERVVLRDVDLAVARGEFLALVGRSGSGKSTLLNLISGIDAPSAGEVAVGGAAISALGSNASNTFNYVGNKVNTTSS